MLRRLHYALLAAALALTGGYAQAENANCFASSKLPPRPGKSGPHRALYVFVDSTMPFSTTAKNKVRRLVENWGRWGDVIKIARFSGTVQGRYPELLFSDALEIPPDDTYLQNLRAIDRQTLLECLETRKSRFLQGFTDELDLAMAQASPDIPRTEIFFSLHELADHMIFTTDAPQRYVFIISDGLENSAMMSFYKGNKIASINISRTIRTLRKEGLIADWKNSNIYMYGIGFLPAGGGYVKSSTLDNLRGLWERYFAEGNGKIRGLGVPELFINAID